LQRTLALLCQRRPATARALTGRSGQLMMGGRWHQRMGWRRARRWSRSWGGSNGHGCVRRHKDLPDNGDGDDDGSDNDNNGDDDSRAINSSDTAAANDNEDDNNNGDEGVPRKTLVTATIRRKMDAANADIPEGGASNGPTTKLRQYSSLNFEALAPPTGGCSSGC
jgi:hypothetical protein